MCPVCRSFYQTAFCGSLQKSSLKSDYYYLQKKFKHLFSLIRYWHQLRGVMRILQSKWVRIPFAPRITVRRRTWQKPSTPPVAEPPSLTMWHCTVSQRRSLAARSAPRSARLRTHLNSASGMSWKQTSTCSEPHTQTLACTHTHTPLQHPPRRLRWREEQSDGVFVE